HAGQGAAEEGGTGPGALRRLRVELGAVAGIDALLTDRVTDHTDARVQIIPVLLYHSVSDHPSPAIAPFAVTPRTFERHLELIVDEGCETLTVSELVDRRTRGELLPPRLVVITFDDGFADTLDVAAPRLWSRGLVATVYLTTGYLAGGTRRSSPRAPGAMVPWERLPE